MTMAIGSACSGYGGADLAAEAVFGARTIWHCEYDPDASKILAHRWSGIPNHHNVRDLALRMQLGDPSINQNIDIYTAGYPCQPFSNAGKRKGADDERNLWPFIRESIRLLRPRFTFLENVAGHRSMGFDRVLGDLAEDGFDVSWTSIRASDIGAPHHRERLFVLATLADPRHRADYREWARTEPWSGVGDAADTGGLAVRQQSVAEPGGCDSSEYRRHCSGAPNADRARSQGAESTAGCNLPTGCTDAKTTSPRGSSGDGLTLRGTSGGAGECGHHRDTRRDAADTTGIGRHGWKDEQRSRRDTAERGETVNRPADGHASSADPRSEIVTRGSGSRESGPDGIGSRRPGDGGRPDREIDWGKYAAAIRRWELVVGPAPAPTEPNSKGNPRLNAQFPEWMMGLSRGWVTEVPRLPRPAQLKAIGNGQCPQQAATALVELLHMHAGLLEQMGAPA